MTAANALADDNDDGLPRVERGNDVHRVLEDLDKALSDPSTGDNRLYQRDGEMVIARGVTAADAKRLKINFTPQAVVLAPLKSATLIPRITEHVDYGYWGYEEKTDEDGKKTRTKVWRPQIPSGTVLAGFLGKVYWAYVRPIRGVSATPIIHLDGSIAEDGYDRESQYLVASNIKLPSIPAHPTREQATVALQELQEPFAEFPFETKAERYSPVALTLTILMRPVIRGNVPAFLQTAPQKNCGKSLATKGACLLATGQIPASNTWAKLDEEQEKMIGAAADAAADVLFFDNVQEGAVIGGAPLDKVLTCDGHNSFRVLGLTKLKRLPWGAVVAFTANRARIGGDTDRRIVVATLIRPDVPPETFTHPDLLVHIQLERARLLAAAFTLIRAWIQDGAKSQIRRLDSFEHWANTVAAMIVWAGGGDVRSLVRDTEGTDTDNLEFTLLRELRAWLNDTGKPEFTVGALVAAAFGPPAPAGLEALREAIEVLAGFEGKGESRKLDTRRFGKRLSKMKDVLQGGYRLKQTSDENAHVSRWNVVDILQSPTPTGVQGVRGVESNPSTRAQLRLTSESGHVRSRG